VCLSLRATRGIEPEWNDPARSRHHRLIPLGGPFRAPMVEALVAQLGIPGELYSAAPSTPEKCGPFFGVFHVEHARGSAFVPAQEDFVERYRIQAVLGFGGPLPRGEVFVVLLFSQASISKWTAELFRSLAPSIGIALIPAAHDERSLEARLDAYEQIVRAHERVALADLRERERLLVSAEEANAEAQAAIRSKDEFLAALGHELRNPLAPIVTAVELIKMRGGGSHELDIVERQVKSLRRLVDDILDVERIARGKLKLDKAPIEIASVVDCAIEMTGPVFERRGQRLALEVPRSGAEVRGDLDRLAQVVSNLLSNASKFSPVGSQVSLTAEREGDIVRLCVRDEGIGIAKEMLESIFGAFVQERPSGQGVCGLGLGLTIVRNLVALHGGRVFARSDGPGKGSEFVVELPVSAG
jgi:signal transduction histidine kinase